LESSEETTGSEETTAVTEENAVAEETSVSDEPGTEEETADAEEEIITSGETIAEEETDTENLSDADEQIAADGESAADSETDTEMMETETVTENLTETESEMDTEDVTEVETETEEETETETEAQVLTYFYEDSKVSVTATLQYASAVPDDAEFRVTEITASSSDYNYEAYMQALNDNSEALVSSDDYTFTSENTLLYDIGFFVTKTDEEGNEIEGEVVEYQPEEGSVSISFVFKKNQLSTSLEAEAANDITVVHLPLDTSIKESVDTTAEATDISASDVNVEVVDANVSLNGTDQVTFSLSDFSAMALTNSNTEVSYSPTNSYTYTDILGNAVYFGVVADTLTLGAHMDSNFAVNTLNMANGSRNVTVGAYTGVDQNGGVFVIASMTNNNTLTVDRTKTDVWTTDAVESYINLQVTGSGSVLIYSQSTLNAYVNAMLSHVSSMSNTLNVGSEYEVTSTTIDISNGDDGTYYFDGDSFSNYSDVTIIKKSTQTIVFNYSSSSVTLKRFSVTHTDTNTTISSASSTNSADEFARTIIFNMPYATTLNIASAILGVVIAPNANVASIDGTSSGWLVAKSVYNNSEWHNVWSDMPESTKIPAPATLSATKTIDGQEPTNQDTAFTFYLYEWDSSTSSWSSNPIQTKQNSGSDVTFDSINYSSAGTYYYKITEKSETSDVYTYDDTVYIAKVTVSESSGVCSVDSVEYFKTSDVTSVADSNEVTTASFDNGRKSTGELTVSKTVMDENGDEDTTGSFKFTFVIKLSESLTGTYGDIYFEDGTATVYLSGGESVTATGLPLNIEYSVAEVAVDGYTTIVTTTGTVGTNQHTVTGQITTTASTAAFTNSRDSGSLQITKKSVGTTTSEDTTFDLYYIDDSGNEVFVQTIKYSDFTGTDDMEKTYTVSGLPTGTYKIKENVADVSGYTLISVTGDTQASVNKDETTQITITNTYEEDLGGLIVKKLSSGDNTTPGNTLFTVYRVETDATGNETLTEIDSRYYSEFEAAGSFVVTENNSTQLTLGTYRIVESGADIDGYTWTATVTNTVIAVGATGGTENNEIFVEDSTVDGTGYTDTTVTDNYTTTVTITNDYVQDVGNLTLVKTTVVTDANGNKVINSLAGTPSSTVFKLIGEDGTTYEIKYSDFTYDSTTGTYSYTTGDLPVGKYKVEEDGADVTDYILTLEITGGSTASVTVGQTTTVEITNTYIPETGGLKIMKTTSGNTTPEDTEFVVEQLQTDGTWKQYGDIIYYKDFYDLNGVDTYLLLNIPTGTYRVTENRDSAQIANYTLNVVEDHTATIDTADELAEVEITNIYTSDSGTLKVTKVTTGNATPDDTVFTVRNASGTVVETKVYSDFKDDGYFEVTNLPVGTYTVTESTADVDHFTYTVTVDYGTDDNGEELTSAAITKNETTEVTITNTYTSETTSVSVQKKWSDSDNIYGTRPAQITINLLADGSVYESKTVTASDGWSYTFTGLPKYVYNESTGQTEEVRYTVSENSTENYSSSVAGYTVTNTLQSGSLTVSKTLAGNATDSTKEFTFTITLGSTAVNGTFGGVTFTNGVATITLKGGDSQTILGLPAGISYAVAEADYTAAGYVTTSTGATGTISAGIAATAAFTNTRNEEETEPVTEAETETEEETETEVETETETESTVSVKVSKVDVTTQEELPGATIQILDKDGNVVDEWVSTTTPHEVTRLTPGETYTLVETVAPEGYEIAASTTFTMNADGTVDTSKTTTTVSADGILLVEDSMITSEEASITVTKTLTYDGETLGAENATFYVALYVDEACTNRASEVLALTYANTDSASVTFSGLEVGRTYYIAECNAAGTALESGVGTLSDGTIFASDFEGSSIGTVAVEDVDDHVTVSFTNEFYSMPKGYYIEGTLTITKNLLGVDGAALNSDAVFYAGIFSDASYTTLADNVSENIVALNLAGGSSVSTSVQVAIDEGETVTLYVTEVDANGSPVANATDFLYTVTVDATTVTLDEDNTAASVTITNQEIEIVEEESNETTETESEKESETTTTAVQTGDSTPILPYLAVMLAAMLVMVAGLIERKRKAGR